MRSQELLPEQERKLIALARHGDEQAFRELVEPYRDRLQAHGYRMLGSVIDTPGLRRIETRANGQPALAWYHWDEREHRFAAAAIEVYSFAGERLAQIAAFPTPALFDRFGLPATVAG